MDLKPVDAAHPQMPAAEAELCRAIARSLDQIGVELDKAMRIAELAARHCFQQVQVLPDYGDEVPG